MEPRIRAPQLQPLLPIPCTCSRDVEMRNGSCSVSGWNLGRLGNWCFGYRHSKCTNLFEVLITSFFGHLLSVELGLIRSCPPHENRFWWRKCGLWCFASTHLDRNQYAFLPSTRVSTLVEYVDWLASHLYVDGSVLSRYSIASFNRYFLGIWVWPANIPYGVSDDLVSIAGSMSHVVAIK